MGPAKMTPLQKIRWIILRTLATWRKEVEPDPANVDALWADAVWNSVWESIHDDDGLRAAVEDVRGNGVITGIVSGFNQDSKYGTCTIHYEVIEVATQAPDGSWVGWPYYFGGGRHSCPYRMGWMEHTYDLDCKEETKGVRMFSKLQEMRDE